jgi:PLP dependent protein
MTETSEPAAIRAALVADNVHAVRERVDAAARSVGRDASSVRIIGVTKGRPIPDLEAVVAAGITDLGENRAHEIVAKSHDPLLVRSTLEWHMIGQCQTNKVASIVRDVTWWHSVDRPALADQLARCAAAPVNPQAKASVRAIVPKVLVQLDTTGEDGRGGVDPGGLAALLDHCAARGLDVVGLMTIAPLAGDPRPAFDLVDSLCDRFGLHERSMGMTSDFEAAIRHGSTMVRIGRALFADRRHDPSGPS